MVGGDDRVERSAASGVLSRRGAGVALGLAFGGVVLVLAACSGEQEILSFMKADSPSEGYAQPAVYPDPEAEAAEGGSGAGVNYANAQYDGNDEIVNGKCLPDHPVSYCITIDDVFKQPAVTLDYKDRAHFLAGNRVFNANWVPAPKRDNEFRDGLGPMFDATSCVHCHVGNGRGRPPKGEHEAPDSMILRISVRGDSDRTAPEPHPEYGEQFNVRAIAGSRPEGRVLVSYEELSGKFPDGEAFSLRRPKVRFADLSFGPLGDGLLVSPRIAPPVIGLGLLESVEEEKILARADPDDADGDGISGRPNYAPDPADGEIKLGRFGWKAGAVSLRYQSAGALAGDMGITSGLYPVANCSDVQPECLGVTSGGTPEIVETDFKDLVFYIQLLSPTARRHTDDPRVTRGEELFAEAGCAACHETRMVTGYNEETPILSNLVFQPYSDFLLHDMGEGLADRRPEHVATGCEWRTQPLMGLGYTEQVNAAHAFYLHDGRARNLMEAVLWHGGEGKRARNAVLAMPKADRDALVAFLKSL